MYTPSEQASGSGPTPLLGTCSYSNLASVNPHILVGPNTSFTNNNSNLNSTFNGNLESYKKLYRPLSLDG
ncbi:hypothetical protein F8M41_025392 [Gigaspora margarita]|uniref:Uncharacterized protein n=1 Tax=Gigaspora margarita TaxID=4874 RepID=A0A8H4ABM8_GIGMA|nr:hypothetical protein F8M41_025392 [Gigaspora margarita]